MVRALSAIDLWSLCYAKNGPDGRSLRVRVKVKGVD